MISITITLLSALFVCQSLGFQTDIADALTRVGPVDKDDPHACPWDADIYRCCSGYYYDGSQCIECPKDKYGYGCGRTCKCKRYEHCNPVNGCQCDGNKWGYYCGEPCSQPCDPFEECDKRNGKCSCPPGKWGESSCDGDCQCYNTATCDRSSGKCQCLKGWIGEGCTDCDESERQTNGTYFCTEKCQHCFNGDSCNITLPGDCHCTPGWTGNKCNVSIPVTCDPRFNTEICRDHTDCDDLHLCNQESCTCNKCILGYRGENCNLPCELGKFGHACERLCSDACGSEKCHHVTGKCISCPVGYHGENCDAQCPAGYYGYNCQKKCQCSDKCNHEVGCTNEDSTTPMQTTGITASLPESLTQGQTYRPDQETNGKNNSTGPREPGQDLVKQTEGDPHDSGNNSSLIIAICVLLVLLIIVFGVVYFVIRRMKKRTNNSEIVNNENAHVADERSDDMEMPGNRQSGAYKRWSSAV
ncbi:scavenger receptor class F member 1-like [Ptychodera flava]|uniref:scavenger receptor class F member 1-like n=1 Tax=Ptychodera flava TaxID=63121 RepID=UPI003969D483